MTKIWYLLKCPEGIETECIERCSDFVMPEELREVICFQYQRMIRYAGMWHLEKRVLLPGCIFLSGSKTMTLKKSFAGDGNAERKRKISVSLSPCEIPYAKELCEESSVIGISQGVIWNGKPVVMSGPLKGRESLIRKIDRHKRTAVIEIPFSEDRRRVTVGLEIYEKQM